MGNFVNTSASQTAPLPSGNLVPPAYNQTLLNGGGAHYTNAIIDPDGELIYKTGGEGVLIKVAEDGGNADDEGDIMVNMDLDLDGGITRTRI